MKKNKTILTTLSFLSIFLMIFTQNALADLLPPDGGWDTPSKPNISPEPKTFIDLIEPQHIIIGGVVLAVVIISLIVLFKMRKK